MPRELDDAQIRVLGCLVEKEMTTPDNYPLSSNALVAACNQTTNREPVVHYTERQVDQVVLTLRDAGLVRTVRGDGQRVHKHKHVLGEAWHLGRAELALVSVLMLRGPQTVNELRTRTERHGTGLDAAGVEAALHRLAEGDEPFVRLLARRAGEREARWVHLVGGEAMAAAAAASVAAPAPVASGATTAVAARDAEVAALRERLDDLSRRFDELCARLGETVE